MQVDKNHVIEEEKENFAYHRQKYLQYL